MSILLQRITAKYPDLRMMLCSGGGGRTDYEGLKYFTEVWPSDNTDPVDTSKGDVKFCFVIPVFTKPDRQ